MVVWLCSDCLTGRGSALFVGLSGITLEAPLSLSVRVESNGLRAGGRSVNGKGMKALEGVQVIDFTQLLPGPAATRLLASQLYHVSATDPAAFGGSALLFLVVAAIASYLPARRAMRVDPIQALRQP